MSLHRKPNSLYSFLKNESGAALVEISLLLPLLIGLMLGTVEFGRVFQQYHVATKGVTSAARYLSRIQTPTLCDGTPGGTWTNNVSDAKDLAQRGFLHQGNGSTGNFILETWTNPNDISVSVDCFSNNFTSPTGTNFTTYRGPDQLPRITVTTTFTYNKDGLFKYIYPSGASITASHTEYYIGG